MALLSHSTKCHESLATPHGYYVMYSSPMVPCVIHLWYPTRDTSKNVKFQLSWNPTKFDRVTRFRETNSMVKSISSSEI